MPKEAKHKRLLTRLNDELEAYEFGFAMQMLDDVLDEEQKGFYRGEIAAWKDAIKIYKEIYESAN